MGSGLMISTSGIRGVVGKGLDPILAARYAAAFGTFLERGRVVLGRDSRPSGEIFRMAAIAGLRAVGRDVIDIGVVPTPTVEIAVRGLRAAGGICLTASHNPAEWNALKLFNNKGEFINKDDLDKILTIVEKEDFDFTGFRKIGELAIDNTWVERHVRKILKLKIINRSRIRRAGLKVVVDAVNGAGSKALPMLLEELGARVIRLNCEGDGNFVHRPEPVPANLKMLGSAVKKQKADIGMACDPDADRLALVDESGRPVGEEYTLALAVKYVLSKRRGPVVINLSTSRITEAAATGGGARVYYTPVGEANVVAGMKKHRALIGGEGNGGVIYPPFHSGRDALLGAAVIAGLMADTGQPVSKLAGTLPIYFNIKSKAPLPAGFDRKIDRLEKTMKSRFPGIRIDRRDGLRFDFANGWLQIRKSNTEPIYRLIMETGSRKLSRDLKSEVEKILK